MSVPPSRLIAALADRYRIERELGAGGMATVYLAHDLRHDRKVALKVLKPELAAVLGAERFVVEIKTTAALQHPHILPLFDSGEAHGPDRSGPYLFYVMPFIDGETLRGKLDREVQIGVDEAVRITREVADALEYAHEHGVIHRDIKPENILLANGRPMVADFGIALAVSAAAGGRMTETGLSLGTPHYMSPEQATADKTITARSDVYSLASVLYEMLAGEPPHSGGSAQAIIMKIVTDVPRPVGDLRKSVPPHVAAALAKALEKVPADRFESAKAFAEALANPAFAPAGSVSLAAAPTPSHHRALIAGLTTVAVVAVGLAAWAWSRSPAVPAVVRYRLAFAEGQEPGPVGGAATAAPDGSFLVYHGRVETGARLWLKRRESVVANPIPGTEGATTFAISPDGSAIAFVRGGELRRVPVTGGAATTLVTGNVFSLGVAWLDDDTILFSQGEAGVPRLGRIAALGGEITHLFPEDSLLTRDAASIWGTTGLLYLRCARPADCEVWALDRPEGGAPRRLVDGGVSAVAYATTGHVVTVQGTRLVGIPLDPDRLELTGPAVTLQEDIGGVTTGVLMTLSRSGTLVVSLEKSDVREEPYDMVWVDRSGRVTPVDTTWRFTLTEVGFNHGWALSPDDRRVAIGLNTAAGDDIWVKELPRGPAARVTFASNPDHRPRWMPDGESIVYLGFQGSNGVFLRRADGTGQDRQLVRGFVAEVDVSPDGQALVMRMGGTGGVAGGRDLSWLRLGQDSVPRPLLATPADEMAPMISPDGRWLAYQSDETGTTEIFLRRFPEVDSFKRQVSNRGGVAPLWSRDGRELFYLGADSQMVVVRVTDGAAPAIGEPARLFRVPTDLLQVETAFHTPWDVARDGRFLMARLRFGITATAAPQVVAEHWLTELAARVPR